MPPEKSTALASQALREILYGQDKLSPSESEVERITVLPDIEMRGQACSVLLILTVRIVVLSNTQ